MIGRKYRSCKEAYGALDGLKVYLEATDNEDQQGMFYNGWKCDHYISNLFLFILTGKIIAAYFNAPGSVHDSTMARMSGMYDAVDDIYCQLGAKVVGDSAFAGK